jgi:hypothetical protein
VHLQVIPVHWQVAALAVTFGATAWSMRSPSRSIARIIMFLL